MLFDPQEGVHYPGSTGDFLAWFSTDVDCLDYLTWLRWPPATRQPSDQCGTSDRQPALATTPLNCIAPVKS
jgi:hypothetical protein